MFAKHLEATKVLSGNTSQRMPYQHSLLASLQCTSTSQKGAYTFLWIPDFCNCCNCWRSGGFTIGAPHSLQSLKTSARGFWLQISLKVGAEIPPFEALTGLGSTTGTFQEEIGLLRQSQRLQRQPRVKARLNDKVHFLHQAILSRLGEVAVLLNTSKQTQRVKRNEETKEYVPNKRTS